MKDSAGNRIFRRPEEISFRAKDRVATMDHGIRLRSDSTGSMKSAFYQGKIVSASKNSDGNNDETEHCTLRHSHSNRHSKRPNNWDYTSTASHAPPPAGRPASSKDGGTGEAFSGSRHQDAQPKIPRGSTLSGRRTTQEQSKFSPPKSTQSPLTMPNSSEPPSGRSQHPFLADNSGLLQHSANSAFSPHHKRDPNVLRGTSFLNNAALSQSTEAHSPIAVTPERETDETSAVVSNHRVWSQPQTHPLTFATHPVQHARASQFPDYGTGSTAMVPDAPLQDPKYNHFSSELSLDSSIFEEDEIDEEDIKIHRTFSDRLLHWLDPSDWLSADVKFNDDGTPYFEEASKWSAAGIVRSLLYNPVYPEFTSLQQFSWAVIIGIFMGIYTAAWKLLIENCVDIMWRDIPEKLLEMGVFTGLDGAFPIYHYMWIVPSTFGGVLSFIFASLSTPIPGQNEWIHSLHSRGVQDFDTFGLLFVLSTAGMTSGLSLGPELPLILTAGMIGSWLAVLCKQSMLQARVLNLTAASASIGGFFGFPMAGALFVLEVPHRMGLQYFEALTPATIASIVAVLTNRLATGNDVTGYYEYPFLNETLPSHIFKEAIIYGLFGCALGVFYTKAILALKHFVHELFHDAGHTGLDENNGNRGASSSESEERLPLFGTSQQKFRVEPIPRQDVFGKLLSGTIPHKALRAGVSGWLVGLVVGITCIFIPHVMFWGEAQLQSLIDKGRTPLPVFGSQDEPTGGLVALGFCMGDHESGSLKSGFSLGCSATIVLAKIFVTGLSLGTGIVGGHFWAPLFAGCAAAHFLTDLAAGISDTLGFSSGLAGYPCVALLCIMGSAHVVAFRAHIAIILILTLTIDAFDPKDDESGGLKVAGDYSAVFPLLTVAVFVALQASRRTVFYEKQRSRGDIMAMPEVLCEPGKEGRPLVMDYEGNLHELNESEYEYESDSDEGSIFFGATYRSIDSETTQLDIEAGFEAEKSTIYGELDSSFNSIPDKTIYHLRKSSNSSSESSALRGAAPLTPSPLPPRPNDGRPRRSSPANEERSAKLSLRTLDELLDAPVGEVTSKTRSYAGNHRRTMSEPFQAEDLDQRTSTTSGRKSDGGVPASPKKPVALKRVSSFGQVDQGQPCLLEQARRRAASFASDETMHKMKNKTTISTARRPVRKNTS